MKLYKTQMSGSIIGLNIYKPSNEVDYPYNLLFDVAAKRKLLIVVNDEAKLHRTLIEYIIDKPKVEVFNNVEYLLSNSAPKQAPIVRDMYVLGKSAKRIAKERQLQVTKVLSARSSAISKMSKHFYKYINIRKGSIRR